jgi:hypothetical protein
VCAAIAGPLTSILISLSLFFFLVLPLFDVVTGVVLLVLR